MATAGSTRRYGRYAVETSNEDKPLFPDDGISKGDLMDYSERIAGTMLPHLRDRPLVMQRFPDGIRTKGFFHKQVPEHFPDWIERARVRTADGRQDLVVCANAATLVYLADQACITPHAWLSRTDRLDRPDQLVIDLDPPSSGGGGFRQVRWAARRCRELLEALGLVPFLKTTGSRGLHVMVPLDRSSGFDEVRAFARRAAELLARRHGDRLTTAQRRARRGGRIYLDTGRNARGQTAVAPYAVRARPGAPVATPIDWDELGRAGPRTWTIRNVLRRLGQRDDPWKGAARRARSLTAARRRLEQMDGRN